jgi:predicted RNase H-like HicB family nuclease
MAAGRESEENVYEVTAIVHAAEEGGYWVEIVDLPGCASQGETVDEALANVQEALRAVIRSYVEDGEDVPLTPVAAVRTLRVPVPA